MLRWDGDDLIDGGERDTGCNTHHAMPAFLSKPLNSLASAAAAAELSLENLVTTAMSAVNRPMMASSDAQVGRGPRRLLEVGGASCRV
jgi:hypothetical protein